METSALDAAIAAAPRGAAELTAALDSLRGTARVFATVTLESIFEAHGPSATRTELASWERWESFLSSALVMRWAPAALPHVPVDALIARVRKGHEVASDAVLSRVAVALRSDAAAAQLALDAIVDTPGARIKALTELEIGVLAGDAPKSLAKLVRAAAKQRNLGEGIRALAAAVRCVSLLSAMPPDHAAVTAAIECLLAMQKKNVGRRSDSCARLAEAVALCAGAASASEPQWLEHARTLEEAIFGSASVGAAQRAIARAEARLRQSGAREWTSPPPAPSDAHALTLRYVRSIAPEGPRERAMRASAASRIVLRAIEAGDRDEAVEAVRAGAAAF